MKNGNLKKRLESITTKLDMLRQRHEALNARIAASDTLLAERDETISRLNRQIDVLRQEAEHLKVVHTITPSRDDVQRTRAMISELMRDIDRCIADIGD